MERVCEIDKKTNDYKYSGEKSTANLSEGKLLTRDILLFVAGFLLSRCHLIFGAHPLGLAFLAALPIGVWSALLGAVVGALSMGFGGIIFAATAAILVFLRAAVSVDKSENGNRQMFGENLLLRMSISILGGFISAVYEVLLSGFSEATLAFGICMVLSPPILTFIFSGLFSTGVSAESLIHGPKKLFSLRDKAQKERYELIFFSISALSLIFFIGLSIKDVSAFGISALYIYSGLITILTAKRFGAICAMAVGFASSICLSGVLSVAFALAGLCAGGLFGLGNGYAIIIGGVALSAFSGYSSGLGGLLATLPEYIISITLTIPLLKKLENGDESVTEEEGIDRSAEDMVGTMALVYQKNYEGATENIGKALMDLSETIKRHSRAPGSLTAEEYRDLVISVAERKCAECAGGGFCSREDIRPCIKQAEKIALSLLDGAKIRAEDVNSSTEFCRMAKEIAEEINRETAEAERNNYNIQDKCVGAEEYRIIGGLIESAIDRDREETELDGSMTETLSRVFQECGFEDGVIRVFGKRRRHFIMAGRDASGRITSFELRKNIEKAAGVKLSAPEYFRRGEMVLMDCGIRRKLSVNVATASAAGKENEVSGDTISTFECADDYFYALISDGMGSGEVAKETSEMTTEFIRRAVEIGAGKDAIMLMLNRAIKSRQEECSATVDLFELDLLNGEGEFIKSGAAPTFIKRDSSIFRIRSHTAPIGLLSSVDSERTKAEIKPGDHIIMLSDGVSDESEDAPWLLLLLGEPPKKDLREYAEIILSEAKKNRVAKDDMSVIVIRVNEI